MRAVLPQKSRERVSLAIHDGFVLKFRHKKIEKLPQIL